MDRMGMADPQLSEGLALLQVRADRIRRQGAATEYQSYRRADKRRTASSGKVP